MKDFKKSYEKICCSFEIFYTLTIRFFADMLYCLFIDCKGDTDAEYRIPQSIGGYREQMDYNISAGNQIPARIPYKTAGLTAEEYITFCNTLFSFILIL